MYINGFSYTKDNGRKVYYSRSMFKEQNGVQYVYYDRLAQDHPDLYAYARNRYKWFSTPDTGAIRKVSDYLRQSAETQLKIEREAMEQGFGVQFDYDIDEVYTKGFYKELIETINIYLQGRKIFERNRDRLLYTGKSGKSHGMGKIDISSLIPQYLESVLTSDDGLGLIASEVATQIELNPDGDLNLTVSTALTNVLPKIFEMALEKAFSSQAFTESQNKYTDDSNERTADAYKELLDWMKTTRDAAGRNPLVEEIYKQVGVESSIAKLTEALVPVVLETKDLKKLQSDALKGFGHKIVSRSDVGFIPELVMTQIGNIINSGKDVNFEYTGGRKQQRAQADWRILIGGSIGAVGNAISDTLVRNKEGVVQVGDSLERLFHKGGGGPSPNFIAYVNAKNYTISDKYFRENGFTASSPTSLENALNWLPNRKNAEQLIAVMMQMADGAIGDKNDLSQVTAYLSEAIAHFLFNDFATDNLTEGGDGQHFHLFWLSGTYVPLSWFLFAISEALAKVASDGGLVTLGDTNGLYKFELKNAPLLYVNYDFSQDSPEERMEKWREQGQDQRRNSTIQLKFLSNFQRIMTNILK